MDRPPALPITISSSSATWRIEAMDNRQHRALFAGATNTASDKGRESDACWTRLRAGVRRRRPENRREGPIACPDPARHGWTEEPTWAVWDCAQDQQR